VSSDNQFLLQNVCQFLASLTPDFEPQLLASNLFLDALVPHIASQVPATRHWVREAIYKMVHVVSAPVPNLVAHIWSVNERVAEEKGGYLTLLARSIENQGWKFEGQSIEQMAELVMQFLSSGDSELVVGSLAVATVLLLSDETVYEALLETTIATIFACLEDPHVPELVRSGLKGIQNLGREFKEPFLASADRIEQLHGFLENPGFVEEAVMACGSLVPGLPFVEEFLEVLLRLLNRDRTLHIAVHAFQKVSEVAPITFLQAGIEAIQRFVRQSGDEDSLESCFDSLAFIASRIAHPKIGALLIEIAVDFLAARVDKSTGIPVIKSFSGLLTELLRFKTDANRQFFEFATQMISSEGPVDAALSILADGVEHDGWVESEVVAILEIVGRLADSEADLSMVQSCAWLVFQLVSKQLLDEASIKTIWEVLCRWAGRLVELKDSMNTALVTVVQAIWAISLSFKLVDDVVRASFQFFPPEDIDETGLMTALVLQMTEDEVCIGNMKAEIVGAIARLLCLSPMIHKRMKVTKEQIEHLAAALRRFCEGDEATQAIVTAVAELSPHWRTRLQAFLV
jgi:hypothetical protein